MKMKKSDLQKLIIKKKKEALTNKGGKETMGGNLMLQHRVTIQKSEVFNSLIWKGLAPALYFGFSFLFVCFSLPEEIWTLDDYFENKAVENCGRETLQKR